MTDDHLAAAERWADAQPVRRRGAPWLNTRAEHRPACIADCAQGRAPCPTPAQCGVSAPAPAEAGTDIGADPHEQRLEAISAGVWWAVLAGLLAWLVVIASLLVVPF